MQPYTLTNTQTRHMKACTCLHTCMYIQHTHSSTVCSLTCIVFMEGNANTEHITINQMSQTLADRRCQCSHMRPKIEANVSLYTLLLYNVCKHIYCTQLLNGIILIFWAVNLFAITDTDLYLNSSKDLKTIMVRSY